MKFLRVTWHPIFLIWMSIWCALRLTTPLSADDRLCVVACVAVAAVAGSHLVMLPDELLQE